MKSNFTKKYAIRFRSFELWTTHSGYNKHGKRKSPAAKKCFVNGLKTFVEKQKTLLPQLKSLNNMMIINVITTVRRSGEVENIKSFPINKNDVVEEVVKQAEDDFINTVKDIDCSIDDYSIRKILENGYYIGEYNYVGIVWSK